MSSFAWRLLAALCLCSSSVSASAEDTAPANDPKGKGVGLSVGTGPQPIDRFTLGLLGLGGRVILVNEKRFDPVIGFSHTSARLSSFPEDSFGDRDFTRLGTTTGFFGVRGGGAPRADAGVVAYGIGGGLLTRQAVGNGEPGEVARAGGTGLGGLAGLGLDAFLAPGLSVGAELGGLGVFYLGGSRFDGSVEDRISGLVLSSFAAVQVTVWK